MKVVELIELLLDLNEDLEVKIGDPATDVVSVGVTADDDNIEFILIR